MTCIILCLCIWGVFFGDDNEYTISKQVRMWHHPSVVCAWKFELI